MLYLSLLLLIVKFNLDLDWLLSHRLHQFRLCFTSRLCTWSQEPGGTLLHGVCNPLCLQDKGCHSSTFKTVSHTSSKHCQNTLSLQPNIKTYVKLELCMGTEYMLLKIRLCIVFKQQNFRTVHHFKSLGFLFVLKLKKVLFFVFVLLQLD